MIINLVSKKIQQIKWEKLILVMEFLKLLPFTAITTQMRYYAKISVEGNIVKFEIDFGLNIRFCPERCSINWNLLIK